MITLQDNTVWQFGIVHEAVDGTDIYSVCEVYLENGVAVAWSEPNLFSETLDSLHRTLEDIRLDIAMSPVFEAADMTPTIRPPADRPND